MSISRTFFKKNIAPGQLSALHVAYLLLSAPRTVTENFHPGNITA
jgi:hypothetical protein